MHFDTLDFKQYFADQEDLSPGKRPNAVLSYWVSGRLFLSPHPRECYVCYHDSAPQVNWLLEVGFYHFV